MTPSITTPANTANEPTMCDELIRCIEALADVGIELNISEPDALLHEISDLPIAFGELRAFAKVLEAYHHAQTDGVSFIESGSIPAPSAVTIDDLNDDDRAYVRGERA